MELAFLGGFALLSALVAALLVRSGKTRAATVGTAIAAALLTVASAVLLGNAGENAVDQAMASEAHSYQNALAGPTAVAAERATRMASAEGQAHLLWMLAIVFATMPILSEVGIRRLLRNSPREPGESERIARLLVIVVLSVVGMGTGVVLSQYAPLFGGLEAMGTPWSPARQTLIGTHVLAFGFVGAVLGALLAFGLPPRVAAPAASRPSDAESRLKELEGLRAKGLLSDDEYQKKRTEIVGSL